MLYAVILFGLIIVWQLAGIVSALQNVQSDLENMKANSQKLKDELQWHTNYTFACNLMEELTSHKKDIVDGLESSKKDIIDQVDSSKTDIVAEIVPELRDILQASARNRPREGGKV